MPLNFYMLYRLCYLSFYFLNKFKKCGFFKNAKWLRKIKIVFIHIFLFIDKTNIENITTLNLTQNEYLTIIVGVWIVILFLTLFLLWILFKIVVF
ncbi:DUF2649 family protein [Spiroplasma endosymbiont of Polydrusus formosus]|uniref:DUF2649 family protein n=1 Tax=Spiroplasma endosymbiont of Polydrusus formosus TaxID=3139326 RepID=UPI0035B54F39